MVQTYDYHIRCPYIRLIHDSNIWLLMFLLQVYDSHIWFRYMRLICTHGSHIWLSFIIPIYETNVWFKYIIVDIWFQVYDLCIWFQTYDSFIWFCRYMIPIYEPTYDFRHMIPNIWLQCMGTDIWVETSKYSYISQIYEYIFSYVCQGYVSHIWLRQIIIYGIPMGWCLYYTVGVGKIYCGYRTRYILWSSYIYAVGPLTDIPWASFTYTVCVWQRYAVGVGQIHCGCRGYILWVSGIYTVGAVQIYRGSRAGIYCGYNTRYTVGVV